MTRESLITRYRLSHEQAPRSQKTAGLLMALRAATLDELRGIKPVSRVKAKARKK